MPASPAQSSGAVARRARSFSQDVSWTPWALAFALPVLFVHIRYQPKVSLELSSTSLDVSLADLAIALVIGAAAVRARVEGLEPLRRARAPLFAAAVVVGIAFLSLVTPTVLGEEYALAPHAVSVLKFALYALLFPAVVLLVRSLDDASPLFRVTVLWSAAATAWGLLQFVGIVSEFEGRRPGQREPSFVGIHDFSALSGAALALGVAALVLRHDHPLSPRWAYVALVSGTIGVILSGAMTGVAGVWLALAAAVLLARGRGLLDRRGAAIAAACVLAATMGTTLMRAEAITRFAEFAGLVEETEEPGAESYPQRALLAYIGTKIWLAHPISGVGWQASSEEWAYAPHLDAARERFPNQPDAAFPAPEHPWGVQTLYVQVLADLGLVGFASLLLLFVLAVARGIRGARTSAVPLVGLTWLLVSVGVWGGLGLVAGIPVLALTWIAFGLVSVRG